MLREMLRVTFGRASLRRALSMGTKKAGARGKQAAAAVVLGAGAGGGYYIMQQPVLSAEKAEDVDALIIGGGIMGATVAVMLKLLQPTWRVRLVEQHSRVGQEATNEWHNAGTGTFGRARVLFPCQRKIDCPVTLYYRHRKMEVYDIISSSANFWCHHHTPLIYCL